ncbi:sugar ABC transporter permease (plasmid) [Skermanella mucosa]|uniref:carbohydrate ABC transporter permease n=1 Tax=Skermanella mucosa TaxID=1789672 RepID=UPI00192C31D8|nr:sugar ABC transporter permease [Skermanella mucosa]UEM24849.1 sugar ABC transporter permease [Skermanella mucosa]
MPSGTKPAVFPTLWNNGRAAFAFLAPAVVALALIGIFPTVFALVNSFRRYNLARPRDPISFVGFENYLTVLYDPSFWGALGRTFTFLITVVPIQIALGLAIALLLHKPGLSGFKLLARLSLVIPLATAPAVVGLIGRLIFNRDFGVANAILTLVGSGPIEWLGDTTNAFIAVALMDIWQWTPFCALVLLAGLTMVPTEIEEAARLETRSRWQIVRYVQLPFLLPSITVILILRTADILKMFDTVFTMTRGGPGAATELVSVYIQRVGFRVFDQGVASAQAILLLILTIILARLYIKFVYREI